MKKRPDSGLSKESITSYALSKCGALASDHGAANPGQGAPLSAPPAGTPCALSAVPCHGRPLARRTPAPAQLLSCRRCKSVPTCSAHANMPLLIQYFRQFRALRTVRERRSPRTTSCLLHCRSQFRLHSARPTKRSRIPRHPGNQRDPCHRIDFCPQSQGAKHFLPSAVPNLIPVSQSGCIQRLERAWIDPHREVRVIRMHHIDDETGQYARKAFVAAAIGQMSGRAPCFSWYSPTIRECRIRLR